MFALWVFSSLLPIGWGHSLQLLYWGLNSCCSILFPRAVLRLCMSLSDGTLFSSKDLLFLRTHHGEPVWPLLINTPACDHAVLLLSYVQLQDGSACLHKDLYENALRSFVCNCYKLSTTQMSTNWRMDKSSMLCLNSRTLFNHKRSKLQTHAATWNPTSIVLRGRSLTQTGRCCRIPCT